MFRFIQETTELRIVDGDLYSSHIEEENNLHFEEHLLKSLFISAEYYIKRKLFLILIPVFSDN